MLLVMEYILKHKNIDVLRFTMDAKCEVSAINEVYTPLHAPIGVLNNENLPSEIALNNWWNNRRIPASRDNLEERLNLLGVADTRMLLEKSFGLSLTDCYWIEPSTTSMTTASMDWHKINYYENDFSEDVGMALFDNTVTVKDGSINLMSPDNSSDGNLSKKWKITPDGTRVLIKGSDVYAPQEAFNEVLATTICRKLGIPCADYKILRDGNVFHSVSPNFTDKDTEFINASHIITAYKPCKDGNQYKYFIYCCKRLGITDIEKPLCNMFIVDYIMANVDRHCRNFGFMRDAFTLEWKGMAPVFDTGKSMFSGLASVDLQNDAFIKSENIRAKPFASTQSEQLAMLPIAKYCKDLPLNKLDGVDKDFRESLRLNHRISEEKKDRLCALLHERVEETQQVIHMAKQRKQHKDYERER